MDGAPTVWEVLPRHSHLVGCHEVFQRWSLLAVGWGPVSVRKWQPQERSCQWIFPSISATGVLDAAVSRSPTFPEDALRPLGRPGPGSCGVTASPWLAVHLKSSVCPARVESYGASVLKLFKVRGSRVSSWCQTPRFRNLKWGSELSLLWEYLCGLII